MKNEPKTYYKGGKMKSKSIYLLMTLVVIVGIILMAVILMAVISISCSDNSTTTAQTTNIIDHKITQEQRAELTFNYANRENPNKLYKADGQIVTSISFYINQLLPSMKDNPNGILVVEPALTKDKNFTVVLTIYSGEAQTKSLTNGGDFGEAIESFEVGMSCPPYCP